MKSYQRIGRKSILGLSSLILVSSLGVFADSKPVPEHDPSGRYEVRLREAGCSIEPQLAPIVTEVRAVLPELGATSNVESTRVALERAYGERVQQVSAPVFYSWVKIGGVWVLECNEGAGFEIDFGTHGTVLVAVREAMPAATP